MSTRTMKGQVLSINYAIPDERLGKAVAQSIQSIIGLDADLSISVYPSDFRLGSEWLSGFQEKLETAKAFLFLITPASLNSPWLWFELGAIRADGRARPLFLVSPEPGSRPQDGLFPLNNVRVTFTSDVLDLPTLVGAVAQQFGHRTNTFLACADGTAREPSLGTSGPDDHIGWDGDL